MFWFRGKRPTLSIIVLPKLKLTKFSKYLKEYYQDLNNKIRLLNPRNYTRIVNKFEEAFTNLVSSLMVEQLDLNYYFLW
jgi:hypothetical protein